MRRAVQSTPDQILFELKTRGPTGIRDLAARIGITRQAARAHLQRLAIEDLAGHSTSPGGVGRPRQIWSLTSAGHARFPDAHAQMTVELIEAVRGEFGEVGLARLVGRREKAMAAHYARSLRAPRRLMSGWRGWWSCGPPRVTWRSTSAVTTEPMSLPRTTARSVPRLPRARASADPSSCCWHICWRLRGWNVPSMCSRVRGDARMS